MTARRAGIRFLSVEDVVQIHTDTLEQEGGLEGIRDTGLLDAAVSMPRQQFEGRFLHHDLPAMAGAYLYHLARNHPFIDGNKRVAAMSALVFLRANGAARLPSPKALEQRTLSVAGGTMSKAELIDWFRQVIHD